MGKFLMRLLLMFLMSRFVLGAARQKQFQADREKMQALTHFDLWEKEMQTCP
jgi:hypothetical protein